MDVKTSSLIHIITLKLKTNLLKSGFEEFSRCNNDDDDENTHNMRRNCLRITKKMFDLEHF